jgi:hypothetical protein
VGIDISADGNWIVWSTKSYLAVVNVSFTGNNGTTQNGFTTKVPAIKRVSAGCTLCDSLLESCIGLARERRRRRGIRDGRIRPHSS